MFGVPHLGDKDEEHEMARVGEDGVCDADEGGYEVCLHCYVDGARGGGVEACADHADEASDNDRDDGGDGEPGEPIEGSEEGEEEDRDREDAGVEHEAELVGGEGAEGDLAGKQLTTGCEDGKHDGAEG